MIFFSNEFLKFQVKVICERIQAYFKHHHGVWCIIFCILMPSKLQQWFFKILNHHHPHQPIAVHRWTYASSILIFSFLCFDLMHYAQIYPPLHRNLAKLRAGTYTIYGLSTIKFDDPNRILMYYLCRDCKFNGTFARLVICVVQEVESLKFLTQWYHVFWSILWFKGKLIHS